MQKVRQVCSKSEITLECPTAFEGQSSLCQAQGNLRDTKCCYFLMAHETHSTRKQKQLGVHRQLGSFLYL